MIKTASLILLIPLLWMSSHSHGVAAPILQRGINLASWFANADGRQSFGKDDFATIKHLGFDYVRLPVNPDYLGFDLIDEEAATTPIRLMKLDQAIHDLNAAGLTVLLDLHPEPAFHALIESSPAAQQNLINLWHTLAQHYASIDNDNLAFELLNEPRFAKNHPAYAKLMAATIATIRTTNADRTLVVNAPWVASGLPVDALAALPHLDDTNLIYGLHFYQPYIITHQGIPFGFEKQNISCFRNIPYPLSPSAALTTDLTHCANKDTAAQDIAAYRAQEWNADKIRSLLAPIEEWSSQHSTRVLVLEFGVYRPYIDPASRYRWIRDVRTALDALHIGWAYWDYGDVFGITQLKGETTTSPRDGSVRFTHPQDPRNQRLVEPAAIAALGLSHD